MNAKSKNKEHNGKPIAPLCFLVVGYGILGALAYPYIRPLHSIYAMISQNQTPDFSKEARQLYNQEKQLPTSGTIDASTLTKMKITDQYGKIDIDSVQSMFL